MSRGSLRRPMGFFEPFNSWWSSFFIKNGYRPTKTDIQMWRAENPSWRPELTLEEIVQHSKGRRDPEKNRRYFVEYRRKLKRCQRQAGKKGGRGRQAALKVSDSDEPWEGLSSDDEMRGKADGGMDVDITSSLWPQQPPNVRNAKLQKQCPSADPEPALEPAAAMEATAVAPSIRGQLRGSDITCAGNGVLVDATHVNDGGAGAASLEALPRARSEAATEPRVEILQHSAPVPIRIPVRRACGPMGTKQLRCAALQMQMRRPDGMRLVCARRDGSGCTPEAPAAAAAAVTAVAATAPPSAAPEVALGKVACAPRPSSHTRPTRPSDPRPCLRPRKEGHDNVAADLHLLACLQTPAAEVRRLMPNPVEGACGTLMLDFPRWLAGHSGHGGMPSWVPVLAAVIGNGHQHNSTPRPDGVSGGLTGGSSASGAAVAGVSAAGASTAPELGGRNLFRTCSSNSISTSKGAGVHDPLGAAAADGAPAFRTRMTASTAGTGLPLCAQEGQTLDGGAAPAKRPRFGPKNILPQPPTQPSKRPAKPYVPMALPQAFGGASSSSPRASEGTAREYPAPDCEGQGPAAVACAWALFPQKGLLFGSDDGGVGRMSPDPATRHGSLHFMSAAVSALDLMPVHAMDAMDHIVARGPCHNMDDWQPPPPARPHQQQHQQQHTLVEPYALGPEEADFMDTKWLDSLFGDSDAQLLWDGSLTDAARGTVNVSGGALGL